MDGSTDRVGAGRAPARIGSALFGGERVMHGRCSRSACGFDGSVRDGSLPSHWASVRSGRGNGHAGDGPTIRAVTDRLSRYLMGAGVAGAAGRSQSHAILGASRKAFLLGSCWGVIPHSSSGPAPDSFLAIIPPPLIPTYSSPSLLGPCSRLIPRHSPPAPPSLQSQSSPFPARRVAAS